MRVLRYMQCKSTLSETAERTPDRKLISILRKAIFMSQSYLALTRKINFYVTSMFICG